MIQVNNMVPPTGLEPASYGFVDRNIRHYAKEVLIYAYNVVRPTCTHFVAAFASHRSLFGSRCRNLIYLPTFKEWYLIQSIYRQLMR